MAKLIYAADDEIHIRELLETFFVDAGYEVATFENGDLLYEAFCRQPSDMVILDVMMPGHDGMFLCKELRKISKVPIILLTAKDTEMDYIMGMSIGSDDYIMKPFRPTMLLMKIKAIFRRMDMEHERESENRELLVGNIRISSYERMVYCLDQGLTLSVTEFELFYYLAKNLQKAVSREEILNVIWDMDAEVETRVVDETIRKIRKKLKTCDSRIRIDTVWGHGYKMVEVMS